LILDALTTQGLRITVGSHASVYKRERLATEVLYKTKVLSIDDAFTLQFLSGPTQTPN